MCNSDKRHMKTQPAETVSVVCELRTSFRNLKVQPQMQCFHLDFILCLPSTCKCFALVRTRPDDCASVC